MAVWDEVKAALLDLEGSGALVQHPDPRSDQARQPPFVIHLAPWATDAAEELHRRFGDDVELVVGSLSYPERQPWRPRAIREGRRRITTPGRPIPDIDPNEMTVELDAPIVVASGHHIHGALRIHNLSTDPIVIETNGAVTAQVVDPRTAETVGGYTGYQTAPLVRFVVDPGGTTVVPMLVGTGSRSPELGYAIPAGEWAVRVDLTLEDGRRVRAPMLPITITD